MQSDTFETNDGLTQGVQNPIFVQCYNGPCNPVRVKSTNRTYDTTK